MTLNFELKSELKIGGFTQIFLSEVVIYNIM